MKKFLIKISAAFALLISFSAYAADPNNGKLLADACIACHNGTGVAIGSNPILAGQHRDYLLVALKAYADESRNNAIMTGLVSSLSNESLEDLAVYYSSLPSPLQ